MTTGTASGRYRRWPTSRAAWAVTLLCAGLAILATVTGCGSSVPRHRSGTASVTATPVTAVPDTSPPTSPWNTVPWYEQASRLGRWQAQDRFLVLAALGDQGLATDSPPGNSRIIVFRGELSIPPGLRQEGWVHIGDPDSWHGYLFDPYQGLPGATEKLFEVTTPSGDTHQFLHPLAPHESLNNSFVALTPDGQWMVSGEWGRVDRLLVFPTPMVNRAQPVQDSLVGLAGTISLDHAVRDVQGCAFETATAIICSSADPGTDLWPTPDQLLQVTLDKPLDGPTKPRHESIVTAHVTSLGELPELSGCGGGYEPEGVDYDPGSHTLRVEVLPPGKCGLSIAVYDYRREPQPGQ